MKCSFRIGVRHQEPRQCTWLLALFVAAIPAALVAAVNGNESAATGPDVVLLNQLEDEYEPVPFDHTGHARMADMRDGCITCHHEQPDPDPDATIDTHEQAGAAKVPQCRTCHAIESDAADIQVPSLKGAYHRQCLNCHKDWSGDNNCVICHAPRNADAPAEHAPTPGDVIGRMHPPIPAPTDKRFVARFTPTAGKHVLFRHVEHVERYGISCVHCHQRDTCADCHSDAAAQNGIHRPVEPAASWRNSHGPCMTCHQGQTCTKCHYDENSEPPKPFDHELTGQLLDDDHQTLQCVQCHRGLDFNVQPACGNGDCHGEKVVALPNDRPGLQLRTSPGAAIVRGGQSPEPIWASLQPRPLRPEHLGVDESLAQTPRPSAIVHAETDPTPPRLIQLFGQAARLGLDDVGDPSCVTEECHVSVKAFAYLHGPVAMNGCSVCHELVDEEQHTFTLLRADKELCTYCHEFDVTATAVVHEPVQREECLGCHNPHGGPGRSLMREQSVAATCNRCHESVTHSKAFLHSPVREGQCITCHAPHASRLPKLLDAAGSDLCLACHQQFSEQLADASFTHEAMKEQCQRCHDPHGSNHPLSMAASVPDLCYDCHEQVQQTVTTAAYPHPTPLNEQRSCLNCHTPHGGNLEGLMRDLPRRLCLECHNQPVETPDGRSIPPVPQMAQTQLYGHGPVEAGQCGGCHGPHGTAAPNLLTAGYETELSRRFNQVGEAFCFQCHDAKLILQPSPHETPETQFRNGNVNLHAMHVDDRWGRTCLRCHSRHLGDNEKLVRATLQFKQWEAPIGFRQSETGGFCLAGCHVPLSYDRQTPVPYEATIAKEMPSPVRAGNRPPIAFTACDTTGQTVAVPDENRLTVLIVLRDDPSQKATDLAPLFAALPDLSQVSALAIVTGETASAISPTLAATHVGWRVVADETGQQSKALQIHGWPIVLVIDRQGAELARLSGAPISLAIRLQGYLSAADNPEQTTPPQPIAHIIDDGQHRRIEQYLSLARQFKQADPPQARKVLEEALALHPDAPLLQLALAQTLIELNDAQAALTLLAQIQTQSAEQAHARDMLQAQALISLDRWDDAEPIVESLISQGSDQPDLYQLLGDLRAHQGRWREAAEAYRQAQPR
jgi:predicted CXXCH cytochrome family protein